VPKNGRQGRSKQQCHDGDNNLLQPDQNRRHTMQTVHRDNQKLFKIWDRRAGTATVELALVAPLLLLLLMGIIEFGLLFEDFMILKNASREGARTGATGDSTTTITDKVESAAAQLPTEDLTITQQYGVYDAGSWTWYTLGDVSGDEGITNNAPTGAFIKVEVSYSHPLVATGLLPGLEDNPGSGTINLTGTATFRRE